MKSITRFGLVFFMQIIFSNSFAQTKHTAKAHEKIKAADSTTKEAAALMDNTVATLGNAKKLFKGIAGNVSNDKNKVTVVVSGISFNNPNLTALEDAIKKVKGTKKVSKSLQSGVITITLKYRHDANSLWNKIPFEIKKMYKPVEVVDKSLLLDF